MAGDVAWGTHCKPPPLHGIFTHRTPSPAQRGISCALCATTCIPMKADIPSNGTPASTATPSAPPPPSPDLRAPSARDGSSCPSSPPWHLVCAGHAIHPNNPLAWWTLIPKKWPIFRGGRMANPKKKCIFSFNFGAQCVLIKMASARNNWL